MWKRLPIPLLISGLGLIVLPPVLLALGLTMTSATEVVTYAIACMALNILVGHTGLVFRPDHRGGSDRGGRRSRIRLLDPAPARRVFLVADAGAGGDALCGVVSLDRSHRRRERPRRHHAADAARLQHGILHRLLLVCRCHRDGGAGPVMALP